MREAGYHRPVLLREAVDGLQIKPDGVYVDVTFGGGGHSREILTRLDNGILIAFDQDPDAATNAPADRRFTLVAQNFRHLKNWLTYLGIQRVDGILADLGVSSHQFDETNRGFSIRTNGPLDMRMDQSRKITAATLLNDAEQEELTRILREYGEVERAGRVARHLTEHRPILTTGELVQVLTPIAPRNREHKFLAQVFQALRIAVNEEIDVLKEFLMQTPELLNEGGRLVVISYHSLEDRMVKEFLRTGNTEGNVQKDFYGNLIRPFDPVHSKAAVPVEPELSENPRSRSAKLRTGRRNNQAE
jgi:16S rRNA (cytosine1402-N4)-methyltransferase